MGGCSGWATSCSPTWGSPARCVPRPLAPSCSPCDEDNIHPPVHPSVRPSVRQSIHPPLSLSPFTLALSVSSLPAPLPLASARFLPLCPRSCPESPLPLSTFCRQCVTKSNALIQAGESLPPHPHPHPIRRALSWPADSARLNSARVTRPADFSRPPPPLSHVCVCDLPGVSGSGKFLGLWKVARLQHAAHAPRRRCTSVQRRY